MGLPNKLKNMNLFQNGESFVGQVPEVTLPTLTRKMEGYRGGGMGGEVDIDMGQEKIELEFKAGGLIRSVLEQYGVVTVDGVGLRFVGAYQADTLSQYVSVEVIARGRYGETGLGTAKVGDDTEMPVKMTCVYFKLIWNGVALIEIDIINNILVVDGVDRMAQQRAAMGLL